MTQWIAHEVAANSHVIEWPECLWGKPHWVLLRSDAHHDNAHADWAMEARHLQLAKERNAPVIDGGDLFCAMQGKYDKRADRSQLRPELREGPYLDQLVRHAADFYEPYASQVALMGRGNHETAMDKRHETDLTERLVTTLNERTGSRIHAGAYAGYVRFHFKANDTGRNSCSAVMFRHHGYGGGGPVTKDVIQTNRMAATQPDANIVWSGHTHDQWVVEHERARITESGRIFTDTQTFIKTAGYKEEWTPSNGWHIERGGPPKPRGAVFLKLTPRRGGVVIQTERVK